MGRGILLLGLVLFFAAHSVSIVNEAGRNRMVDKIGELPRKGLYSLVAITGLMLIVWGYDFVRQIHVTSEQVAEMCRRLAARGLFVGPSSDAYVHAALEIAATGRYACIVTVLPDTGERYASTGMWERRKAER